MQREEPSLQHEIDATVEVPLKKQQQQQHHYQKLVIYPIDAETKISKAIENIQRNESVEDASNFLFKILIDLPRDEHGALSSTSSKQLIDTLVDKYGLYTSICTYLKQCNKDEEDPCEHVVSILVLTILNNPEQAKKMASYTELLDEMLNVMRYTLDFDHLKPCLLSIFCNLVMDVKPHIEDICSIVETLMFTEINKFMMPYALNICNESVNDIAQYEDLCLQVIERLRDEQYDYSKETSPDISDALDEVVARLSRQSTQVALLQKSMAQIE